jgi:hypothetical protein
VTDGTATSTEAAVSITVDPVNDAPVADAQSVSVDEDGSVAIDLTGSDLDGDGLTYAVVTPPTNGSLSGTIPNLTYTPNANFNGSDSFTFTVTDGTATSTAATVSITVNPGLAQGYAEWLQEFSITDTTPETDSDKDSISNAVEYVIGGDPVGRADNNLMPTRQLVNADPDGDNTPSDYLLFSYRRTDRSNQDPLVTIRAEWSNNIVTWNPAAGTSGVVILEDDNHFGAGTDRVRVYLPRSLGASGLLFARLSVIIDYTPPADHVFTGWLGDFGLTAGPNDDSDGDSVSNAVEYVIGGNPANQNNAGNLPKVSQFTGDPNGGATVGDYLVFTYRRSDLSNADPDTTIVVEWSTSLIGAWNNSATTPGVIVKEFNDTAGAGIDEVKAYLPRSLAVQGRLFTRLGVTVAAAN